MAHTKHGSDPFKLDKDNLDYILSVTLFQFYQNLPFFFSATCLLEPKYDHSTKQPLEESYDD